MKDNNFLKPGKATIDDNNVIHISPELIAEKALNNERVYLSDFMYKLPSNCMFLKGVTGCGATSLAIADNSNSIIALPTRNTVLSKWQRRDENNNIVGYNEDILCVFGGFNDTLEKLKEYIHICTFLMKPIKIVCTYDQVERIVMRLIGYRKASKKQMEDLMCTTDISFPPGSPESKGYIPDTDPESICIDISIYRLYIDEIHQVLDDYCTKDRRDNIRGLLRCIDMFSDVTCITATPLEEEYYFDETRNLTTIKVNYKFKYPEIIKRDCPYVKNECANVVISHLQDKAFGNAHIFINSVDSILDIIKAVAKRLDMAISDFYDDIRIVCGNNEINENRIRKALTKSNVNKAIRENKGNLALAVEDVISHATAESTKYRNTNISPIDSPVKKINFYTKTAWLGADVYDKTGQMYIVSDNTRPYMMADISTAFIQIIGRIRDSENNSVVLLARFADNRYIPGAGGLSTYDKDLETRSEDAKYILKVFDENPRVALDIDEEKRESKYYLAYDDIGNRLYYDKNLRNGDIVKHKTMIGDYASSANMSAKLMLTGFNVRESESSTECVDRIKAKGEVKEKAIRVPFEKIFKEYTSLLHGDPTQALTAQRIALLETYDSLLKDVVTYLGSTLEEAEEKAKRLEYKKTDLKKEVDIQKQIRKIEEIRKAFLSWVRKSDTFTSKDLKERCNGLAHRLGVSKIKPTIYCDMQETTIRSDGVIIRALKIKKVLTTSNILKRINK